MAVDSIFFASRNVTVTSWYVTGTSLLVSTGAARCYPAPMANNVVHWLNFFLKFYSCSHKKRAKRSHLRVWGDSWTFTCSSKTVH